MDMPGIPAWRILRVCAPRTLAQVVSNKATLLPRYIAAIWPQLSE